MRLTFTFTFTVIVACGTAVAQKSVREFTPAQREALQIFLDKNPGYKFIPETWFDGETLKAARDEWGFGKNFKPYYRVGDFNRDGTPDFAVVLLAGESTNDSQSGMHVVIFNGMKGGSYRLAHVEHEEYSNELFIDMQHRTLFVGVMETDSAGCFVPAGRGYIIEPCGG